MLVFSKFIEAAESASKPAYEFQWGKNLCGNFDAAPVNKLPQVTHYSYWSLLRPIPIVMAHYRRDFHAKIQIFHNFQNSFYQRD